MLDRLPGETVSRLMLPRLASELPCQPYERSGRSSGGCVDGGAALPFGRAGHNYMNSHRNTGLAAAHNSRIDCCRGYDRHTDHGCNLGPDSGRGCFHDAVLGIRYAGRHGDRAPLQVARRRRSAQRLGSGLVFSSRSPRLALPVQKLRLNTANIWLNGSQTSVLLANSLKRVFPLRSANVRFEASVREEAPVRYQTDRAVGAGTPAVPTVNSQRSYCSVGQKFWEKHIPNAAIAAIEDVTRKLL